MFTLTLAAKQTAGDAFALSLLETARKYPYQRETSSSNEYDLVHIGVGRAAFPDGVVGTIKSRLGGSVVTWRSISLKPKPTSFERQKWAQRWNPFGMCSWPPEDEAIESFHTHVREQAKALLGEDLARTEKFTASIKDGIDIRETLRNWHTGDLYVKEIPPARGTWRSSSFCSTRLPILGSTLGVRCGMQNMMKNQHFVCMRRHLRTI